MKTLLKLVVFLLALCIGLTACGSTDTPAPVYSDPTDPTEIVRDYGELTILFTGDIRNVFAGDEIQSHIGYAALAAYRDALKKDGRHVILLDGGNAMSNEGAGAVEQGKTLAGIIDSVGYDFRVVGGDELSYGMDAFLKLTDEMESCTYLSANLVTEQTGEPVFQPHAIVECDGIRVGIVAITSPTARDTLDDSRYGFSQGSQKEDFFSAVQNAINGAVDAGADYVVAIGNLGTNPDDTPWTSAEVIANTTGLSLFLDCGSGSVLEGATVRDLDNYEIPVCAAGSDFAYVGKITLNLNDGSSKVELLQALTGEDKSIAKAAGALSQALENE